MKGLTRSTGYGYSFWEFKVYGTETLNPVPVTIDVPYVQYLKMNIDPADVNGNAEFIVQNTDKILNLTCYEGSPLSLSMLDFRGDFDQNFWTLKNGSTIDIIKGLPLVTAVYKDMVIHVKLTPRPPKGNVPPVADAGIDRILYLPTNSLTIDGSKSSDPDGSITAYKWTQTSGPTTATLTNNLTPTVSISNLNLGDYKFTLTVTDDSLATGFDEVVVSVRPPEQVDFILKSPIDTAMVTDTRKPNFALSHSKPAK
jgi:hypothetical protein